MKKLLIILFASIFIVGCSGNDEEDNNDGEANGNDQVEENDEEDNGQSEDEQKAVYQIGETAQTTSSSYGFPYEVTVNDFEITNEVEGKSIEDFFSEGFESNEENRLAVVNVTLENTGDDSFVPGDTMTPVLTGEVTNAYSEIVSFTDWENEVEPGNEIEGNLVFLVNTILDEEVVYVNYNIHDLDKEVKFELPVPNE